MIDDIFDVVNTGTVISRQHLSSNFHDLSHFCDERRRTGPAFEDSADVFEDNINQLKKRAHGTTSFANQVAQRYTSRRLSMQLAKSGGPLDFLLFARNKLPVKYFHVDKLWATSDQPIPVDMTLEVRMSFEELNLMKNYVIENKIFIVARANIKDSTVYHSLFWKRKGKSASYKIAYRRNANSASQTRRQSVTSKPARDYGEIEYFVVPVDYKEKPSEKPLILVVRAYKLLKPNLFNKVLPMMKNAKLKSRVQQTYIGDTFRHAEKSQKLSIVESFDVLHKVLTVNSNFDELHSFFISEIDYVVQKA